MGRIAVTRSQFLDANCAEFNNGVSNEYAYCDSPSFSADTQGAISIWYRPLSVLGTTGYRGLWGYGVQGASNAMLTCGQRWANSATITATYRSQPIPDIVGRTANGAGTARAYGNHIISANAWMHLVVQSNGTAWSYFVNGSAAGGTAWNGESNTGDWLGDISGATRFVLGGQWISNALASPGDSRLNEACYFSRALTSDEVSWLYNGGAARNPLRGGFGTDLKSWWRCGDSRDTGATIYDEVGSNHLSTVNMTAGNYVSV